MEANKTIYRTANAGDLAVLKSQQEQRQSDYPGAELIEKWVLADEFWVAVSSTDIVGWMSLQHTFFEEGFVSILWVAEEQRRQGIASALMQKAREICKTARLWTSTNRSNVPMQKLMESLGWEYSGSIRHLEPDDPELIYCNWKRS